MHAGLLVILSLVVFWGGTEFVEGESRGMEWGNDGRDGRLCRQRPSVNQVG